MEVSSNLVATGRKAKTKGVSLRPDELADARMVEEATGMGFSEVYHRHFAPQMHAAAELLKELREAGVELDRSRLRTDWDLAITAEQLVDVYTAESELSFGD